MLPPPQILHIISSKCSMDEMLKIHCCEVMHVSKALLPPICAIWQSPSHNRDMVCSCRAWHAQKPAQGAQLDHLRFWFATGGDEGHPDLTAI